MYKVVQLQFTLIDTREGNVLLQYVLSCLYHIEEKLPIILPICSEELLNKVSYLFTHREKGNMTTYVGKSSCNVQCESLWEEGIQACCPCFYFFFFFFFSMSLFLSPSSTHSKKHDTNPLQSHSLLWYRSQDFWIMSDFPLIVQWNIIALHRKQCLMSV